MTVDKLLENYGDYILNSNHHKDKFPSSFSGFI